MSVYEYARRLDVESRRNATAGPYGLRQWLRTNDAADVLDDAVLGCLLDSTVEELCGDYAVTRAEFSRELNAALAEGC